MTRALLGALVLVCVWLLGPLAATAHVGHDRPKLEVGKRPAAPAAGPRGRAALAAPGPLRLSRTADGTYVAGFELRNTGDGPLVVYRVAIATENDGGAQAPGGLGIQTLPRASVGIPPGQSRLYNVVWHPTQTAATQVFAHVIVVTDSAPPDVQEFDRPLMVGIVADRRPLLLRRILSLAVFCPLLVALAALAIRARPTASPRLLRGAAAVVAALSAALGAVPLFAFIRGLGREAGNGGLQLIERSGSGAALEYFLAVDGLTAPLLPVPGLVLFATVVAARDASLPRFSVLAAPLASAVALALTAQSLPLLAVAVVAASLAGVMLAAAGGTGRRLEPGAARLLVAGVVGCAAFVWLVLHLSRASGSGHLLDGSVVDSVTTLPDVLRESLHGHLAEAPLFGLPASHAAWVLAVVSAGALMLVAPFHRIAGELAADADPAHAGMASACLAVVGVFILLRFGVLFSPEAARWGAPGLAVVGAVTLLATLARAATASDLRVVAASLAALPVGMTWLSASSLTPQGTQGALALAVSRPVAATLLVLCAGAIVSRTGEHALSRAGGIARSAPGLGVALFLAVLASAAAPGGAGFWGALLGLLGTAGRAPLTAVALALGAAGAVAVHARLWPLVVGEPHPDWRKSADLEAFGGKVPDLRPGSERAWAVSLGVALILLTAAPRAWIGVSNHVVLDALPLLDPPGPTQVASRAPRGRVTA